MTSAIAPTPPAALCRHCHRREKYQGHRGLCNACYYTPSIRKQHPAQAKYARRGVWATTDGDTPPSVIVEWIVIETAAARLGITEGEVKRLARRGLIRYEFRSPGVRDCRRLESRVLWLWWPDVLDLMEQHSDARRPDPLGGLTLAGSRDSKKGRRRKITRNGDRREVADEEYAGPVDPPILYGLLTASDVAALATRRARFEQIRNRIPLPVIDPETEASQLPVMLALAAAG